MNTGSITDAIASRNTDPGPSAFPPPSLAQRPPTPAASRESVALVASREISLSGMTVFGRTVTGTIGRDAVDLSVSPESFAGGRTVTGTIGRREAVSLSISRKVVIERQEVTGRTVTGTIGRDAVSLSISPEDVAGARSVTGTIGRRDSVSLSISRAVLINDREVTGRTLTGSIGRDAVSVSIGPEASFGGRPIGGRGPLRASAIVAALI